MLLLRFYSILVFIGFIYCIDIRWGKFTHDGNWQSRHRISFPFSIDGKHYFFGMNDSNNGKHWFIQELGEGGKVKSETDKGAWGYYYNHVFPFTINSKQFIFGFSNETYGNFWFIQEILPGGIMGEETDNGKWESTPSFILPYSTSDGIYLYLNTHCNPFWNDLWLTMELLPNGKMGEGKARNREWHNRIRGFPFYIDGRTYMYSTSTDRWFIQELLPFGQLGDDTDEGHLEHTDLTSVVPFSIDNKHYFYGVIKENSQWFVKELLPGGKMGGEKMSGSWKYYYVVSFAFTINERQFMYGYTEHENYWFVQELIQEPRLPIMISTKDSYCKDTLRSNVQHYVHNQFGVTVYSCAIVDQFRDIKNNKFYQTIYFEDPYYYSIKSVSTLRVNADAKHKSHANLTVAMHAQIYHNYTLLMRDPITFDEDNYLRQMDREHGDKLRYILASSLGGPAEIYNIGFVSPLVNHSASVQGSSDPQRGWHALEIELKEYLTENRDNGYIDWTLIVSYRNLPVSRRPTEFYIAVMFYDSSHRLNEWRGSKVREYVLTNDPSCTCHPCVLY